MSILATSFLILSVAARASGPRYALELSVDAENLTPFKILHCATIRCEGNATMPVGNQTLAVKIKVWRRLTTERLEVEAITLEHGDTTLAIKSQSRPFIPAETPYHALLMTSDPRCVKKDDLVARRCPEIEVGSVWVTMRRE